MTIILKYRLRLDHFIIHFLFVGLEVNHIYELLL